MGRSVEKKEISHSATLKPFFAVYLQQHEGGREVFRGGEEGREVEIGLEKVTWSVSGPVPRGRHCGA